MQRDSHWNPRHPLSVNSSSDEWNRNTPAVHPKGRSARLPGGLGRLSRHIGCRATAPAMKLAERQGGTAGSRPVSMLGLASGSKKELTAPRRCMTAVAGAIGSSRYQDPSRPAVIARERRAGCPNLLVRMTTERRGRNLPRPTEGDGVSPTVFQATVRPSRVIGVSPTVAGTAARRRRAVASVARRGAPATPRNKQAMLNQDWLHSDRLDSVRRHVIPADNEARDGSLNETQAAIGRWLSAEYDLAQPSPSGSLTCLGNLSSLNPRNTPVEARVAVVTRFGIKASQGVPRGP